MEMFNELARENESSAQYEADEQLAYPEIEQLVHSDRALVCAHAAGVAVGLAGNLVARLAISGERHTRLRATGALMSGICEANLFVLVASALTHLAPLWQSLCPLWVDALFAPRTLIVGFTQAACSLHSLANTYLLYCALLLAFDRAVAVIDPLGGSALANLTSKRPRGIRQRHALLLLFCALLTAPTLLESQFTDDPPLLREPDAAAGAGAGADNGSSQAAFELRLNLKPLRLFPGYVCYKLLDLMFVILVPVALITVLNALLVCSVRQTLARPLRRHASALASEKNLFFMLTFSTLLLNVCELPTFCVSLHELSNLVWPDARAALAHHNSYWQFAGLCLVAFPTLNVLVCVLTGRRFRQQLLRLFGVRKRTTFAPEPPKRSPSACGAHRAANSVLDERTLKSVYHIRIRNGRLVASAHFLRSSPKLLH